ncbi:dynamin family protein [Treponema phagedenis]|uniref:Dynamin N-terminal domain-containing protein n=1 Tax=Treponema phagedenis TaxID=162 RepID=A0A0B7GR13_TREPH|nr:dynamin family protein [Treponema phagedenis]NVP22873.1 dynamin family protein [Treponema phagedenis]QEJ94948.1 hypothetical protein FUT79_06805 [Treponema phagedenis]QEJ98325.1 hypothetical protein FUT82_10165 [Treponema phagedenis]QEK00849.1 hypothetical protein FUT84_06465 [Treponema phagedenis]QEK03835.1 hypothetical protein FUT83_08475 [Treponema phagedenis]
MLSGIVGYAVLPAVLFIAFLIVVFLSVKKQKQITAELAQRTKIYDEQSEVLKNTQLAKDEVDAELVQRIKMYDEQSEVLKETQSAKEKVDAELAQRTQMYDEQSEKLKEAQSVKDELGTNLSFIASVFNAPPVENESLEEFSRLLNHDYIEYANKNDSLAEEATAFLQLQNVERELQLVVNCPILYKKNIVALAGSFSSGKSSFINSLFQNNDIRLPTGIQPVTALPAYIIAGEKPSITGYSWVGGIVNITKEMFKKFSHDKLKSFSFSIKTILPYVTINAKLSNAFEHICFIDTPGYNPGTKTESDMQTSLEYVEQASALIWVISVESGTLTNDDREMLEKIFDQDPNKQLFVVCNKADLRTEDEVEDVCEEIREQLDMFGIPYVDLMPYSSLGLDDALDSDKSSPLQSFFKSLNHKNTHKANHLKSIVKDIFNRYITADEDRIEHLTKYKAMLNKINLNIFAAVEKMQSDISYYKIRMDKKFKKESKKKAEGTEENDPLSALGLFFGSNRKKAVKQEKETEKQRGKKMQETVNQADKEINEQIFDEEDDGYSETLMEMMKDYASKIEAYEDDIRTAKKLRDKMLACISDIFSNE